MLPAKQAREKASPQPTASQGIPPRVIFWWYTTKVYHQEDAEEEDEEGEGEAPYAPEDNMHWVAQDMLVKAIGCAQVKKAIAARQKQVKDDLDTACRR